MFRGRWGLGSGCVRACEALAQMVQHVAEAARQAWPECGGNGRSAQRRAGGLHGAGEAAGDGAPAAVGIGNRGEAFEEEGAGKLRRVRLGFRVRRAAGALAFRLGEVETVQAARGARHLLEDF